MDSPLLPRGMTLLCADTSGSLPALEALNTAPTTTSTSSYDSYSDSSSRLTSPASRSPTPPSPYIMARDYPSPSSDLSSLGSTPSPEGMHTPQSSQCDEDPSPPNKRRKLSQPRDRTTQQLDLTTFDIGEDEKAQLDKLIKVIHKKRKIVVIAGAGLSTSAGIPDFRSSTGLFKTLKREHNLKASGKDLFDAAVYKDGNSTTSFHAMVRNLSTATKTADPTPFHHMLATLAQEGRLLRLYTQNVDGIDTSLPPLKTQLPLPSKAPWPKTIQLHGTLEHMTCTKCNRISELDPELFDGPSPPPCQHCQEADGVRTQHAGKRSHGVGVLRPRMVLYNEHNPDDEAIGSVVKADMRTRPDALIVVGTTLKVPGVKRIVKEMCGIVRGRRDGVTVWINNDPPPALKDYEWDLVVQGPCDHVASHAAMRRWNDPELTTSVIADEQLEKLKREQVAEVLIQSPSKKNRTVDRLQGPTPAPSPKLKPRAPAKSTTTQAGTGTKKQVVLAGAKRKAPDNASTLLKKTNPNKPAGKRRPTASNKPPKETIKLSFKVGKPNVQSMAPKQTKAGKQEDETTLQPVSPTGARNNASPPYPRKSYADEKGVPLKVETGVPLRESPEQRRRTISPTSQGIPTPRHMAHLLD